MTLLPFAASSGATRLSFAAVEKDQTPILRLRAAA
jgi:hypothetical protein